MQSKGNDDAADDISEVSDDESVKTTTSNRSVRSKKSDKGWSGYQLLSFTTKSQEGKTHTHLKDVISLDSGLSIGAMFMNPNLVTEIKVAKRPILMSTNAGEKKISLEDHVKGFGKVFYDPTSMANIFGLAEMANKYRVTFNSERRCEQR